MDEKISIVMTSYNYADYIKEAIESVIEQTYKNWELIIVDDGSTDNSAEVIQQYVNSDNRIKLFRHEGGVNKGLAASVKLGIEKSKSDWIAFLESDDMFTPDALEEKVRAIDENPDIDLLFTDLTMFQDENKMKKFSDYFRDISLFFKNDSSGFVENFAKIIPKLNIIPTFSVVMLRKKLLQDCCFNSPCKASIDYYLWAQLSNAKIYYLNKKLTYWRIHSDSYINTDIHSWFTRYYFYIKIYYFTTKNQPLLLRLINTMHYARARIIYLKIDKKSLKLNLLNNKLIFEKHFNNL